MLFIVRIATTVFLLTFSLFSAAITTEKEQDIKQLMSLIEIYKMPDSTVEIMSIGGINFEKKANPNISENTEREILGIIKSVVSEKTPELFKNVSSMIDSNYNHSEIKKLIVAVPSSIGGNDNALKRLATDIVPILKKWSRGVGVVIAKRVEKKISK